MSKLLLRKHFDWYVDSINGDDTNDGLTPLTPFQTLGALAGRVVSGCSIALARGSHWREQLTINVDDVTVVAYRYGEKPILDGSDVATGWSKTSGQTNVYQVTVAPDMSAFTWVNVWEDDVFLVRATSLANCDATPGSYYPSSDVAGPITLHVHTSDSASPSANGKTYEYTQRMAGVYALNRSGLSVTGIHTRRNLVEMGSIVTGPLATITDCLVEDGSKHNIYVGEGSTFTGTTGHNAYYGTQSSTIFVAYTSAATGLDVTFENCTASLDALNVYVTGFYQHSGGVGETFLGDVLYRNCIAVNCGYAFGNSGTETSFTIDGFTATGCARTAALYSDATVDGLVADDLINDASHIFLAVAGIALTLRNSTLVVNGTTVQGGMIYGFNANQTVHLDGVTFVNGVVSAAVALSGATSVLTATGCDFDGHVRVYTCTDVNLISDYNHFGAAWYTVAINGVTYASIAAYQAGTGQDTHSTIG